MAHAALKLIPGVDTTRTPALNETAVSSCNLIRFMPDRVAGGLPQKLGGWEKYFPNSIGSIVRALWAWADQAGDTWLGVGAQSLLGAIGEDGSLLDITPATFSADVTVDIDTTIGSNVITINYVGSNITAYDVLWIKTQISVAGLILYGVYQCYPVGADQFQILAIDAIGNPALANASVSTGGAVPTFTTLTGSAFVNVTLADHGLNVGDNFPIAVSTTVNGMVLYGDYTVTEVTSTSVFVIQGSPGATGSSTVSQNGGLAKYYFFIGEGPLPEGTGFGVGPYGGGGFGSGLAPVANPGTPVTTTDWTLDNFGGLFLSNPLNGAIYVWNPLVSSVNASAIPGAPPVNAGMFVAMPQRQIVAWGSTVSGIQDPLLMRWSDVGNYNQWIPLVQNQAGSYRLTRGSRIVTASQVALQALVWTDIGLWSMQYVGQPNVYSFNEIGSGCGCIGRKAAGFLGGTAFWMSQNQFYTYGGDGVQVLPCPIWDVIYQNLDMDNVDKIRFAANSFFNEVSWFFPLSGGTGENSMYVKFNTILGVWDYGYMSRTAWINQSVLGAPIGADVTTYVYQHETSPDADGQPMQPFLQTGYFALTEGNEKMFIDQVWPDMKWGPFNQTQNANVEITFYVTDYPGDTPEVYGPFTVTQATQFITPRFRGRLVAFRIGSSDIGSFWRLGNTRYRVQPDGKYY